MAERPRAGAAGAAAARRIAVVGTGTAKRIARSLGRDDIAVVSNPEVHREDAGQRMTGRRVTPLPRDAATVKVGRGMVPGGDLN
jgi:hypothetical protein